MSEFEYAEPFDIDDGSLSDRTPEQAFVLGVEYQQVVALLERPAAFGKQIHSLNKERCLAAAHRRGRAVGVKWANDDWVVVSSEAMA